MKTQLLLPVGIMAILAGCGGDLVKLPPLCSEIMIGRVVSTSDPCNGFVVQVTGNLKSPALVVNDWVSEHEGQESYDNVFGVYDVCNFDTSSRELLLSGEEFEFTILAHNTGQATGECERCDMLAPLPDKIHKIAISDGECKDLITIVGD